MCHLQYKIQVLVAVFGLALSTLFMPSFAQSVSPGNQRFDPPRWTREDVTRQQKHSTATKEAVAAQQQSIDECRKLPVAEQSECITNARAAYRQEMETIRNRFRQ